MSGISLPSEPVDSLATMISATDIGQTNRGKKTPMNQPSKNYLRSLLYHGRHQNRPSHSLSNTSNGVNQHQKHASESATVTVHGSATYDPTVAKGNFSKRQRGNGLR